MQDIDTESYQKWKYLIAIQETKVMKFNCQSSEIVSYFRY